MLRARVISKKEPEEAMNREESQPSPRKARYRFVGSTLLPTMLSFFRPVESCLPSLVWAKADCVCLPP
jgi:hypothetical protein